MLRSLEIIVLGLALSAVACGGPAEEVCEDYKAAFKTFYATKCDPYLAAILSEALEESVDCSLAIKVRDEQVLYDECFPALEELTCNPLELVIPASCEQQLYFEAPQVF